MANDKINENTEPVNEETVEENVSLITFDDVS